MDAYDKEALREALLDFAGKNRVRLLVALGICVIETRRLKKRGTLDARRATLKARRRLCFMKRAEKPRCMGSLPAFSSSYRHTYF